MVAAEKVTRAAQILSSDTSSLSDVFRMMAVSLNPLASTYEETTALIEFADVPTTFAVTVNKLTEKQSEF